MTNGTHVNWKIFLAAVFLAVGHAHGVRADEVTLVAGDSDYVPPIEKLKKRGIPGRHLGGYRCTVKVFSK